MSFSKAAGATATGKWLAVIGIGEDGADGLGREARNLVAGAEIVLGGKRHLALARSLIGGEARPWPSPFAKAVAEIAALRGRPVCVLASGDPFLHGAGVVLARHFPMEEIIAVPAPSSFSLAAARLGWALQDTRTISLHGKPIELLLPLLHHGRRIIALTTDGLAPEAIAGLLRRAGFGGSTLVVLEALGGAGERITRQSAGNFAMSEVKALNVVAIDTVAGKDARILPLAPGRSETLFAHDGQISKSAVRAVTLAALSPRCGELLWDIGAGSGAVAIEWMLCEPSMRAIAIEADPARSARIGENASAFGVPGLAIVTGRAPDALAGLAQPDAVFVGGGGSDEGVMAAAIAALGSGGRLTANAVTLEMEAVLLALHARHGGELLRLGLARPAAIGAMQGWKPAMPITQWSWVKP